MISLALALLLVLLAGPAQAATALAATAAVMTSAPTFVQLAPIPTHEGTTNLLNTWGVSGTGCPSAGATATIVSGFQSLAPAWDSTTRSGWWIDGTHGGCRGWRILRYDEDSNDWKQIGHQVSAKLTNGSTTVGVSAARSIEINVGDNVVVDGDVAKLAQGTTVTAITDANHVVISNPWLGTNGTYDVAFTAYWLPSCSQGPQAGSCSTQSRQWHGYQGTAFDQDSRSLYHTRSADRFTYRMDFRGAFDRGIIDCSSGTCIPAINSRAKWWTLADPGWAVTPNGTGRGSAQFPSMASGAACRTKGNAIVVFAVESPKGQFMKYDIGTNTWCSLGIPVLAFAGATNTLVAYSPITRVLVASEGLGIWQIAPNGTITRKGNAPCNIDGNASWCLFPEVSGNVSGGNAFTSVVADPVTGKFIFISWVVDKTNIHFMRAGVFEYDPAKDTSTAGAQSIGGGTNTSCPSSSTNAWKDVTACSNFNAGAGSFGHRLFVETFIIGQAIPDYGVIMYQQCSITSIACVTWLYRHAKPNN